MKNPPPVKCLPSGGGLFYMGRGKYPESPTEKQDMGGFQLLHQPGKIPEGVP